MTAAKRRQRSEYIREPGNSFLPLFPFRHSYISAAFPDPGHKPNWVTESRHPLSDRRILQGGQLFGVRFGPQTSYCMLDIDIDSRYHPAQNPFAIEQIKAALEPLDLTTSILCTSSETGGLHLYFPFKKPQRSWRVADAVSILLKNKGFKLLGGQLEIFPNTRKYTKTGAPSLFNAHRLPLQEPGSQILGEDNEPVYSSPERFAELWQRCQANNLITATKISKVLKQQKRPRQFLSEKANKFYNDLESEINLGWTGRGMTNRLLGRLVMRYFIFHHAVSGGDPLAGQALINEVVAAAKALPGFKAWCRHGHELKKRVTDWVRSIENSHYFPYGSELGKYKAPTTSPAQPAESSYHQNLINQTQAKIKAAIEALKEAQTWPQAITKRFKALQQQGIGTSSLYRYKSLWHPKFESKSEESKPVLCDCPPACPEGAAELAHSHKLIPQTSRNCLPAGSLREIERCKAGEESRNSLTAGEFTGLGRQGAISKTKELLAQALVNPPWKHSTAPKESFEGEAVLETERYGAFWEQHLGYLASGDGILAAEALSVLTAQLDGAWSRQRQQSYQRLLQDIATALQQSETPPLGLIEQCKKLLLPDKDSP